MTERLTTWVEKDHAIPRPDIRSNGHQKCINKLADLEDLEGQGRLVVLPEELDKETLSKLFGLFTEAYCPSRFGLKDLLCPHKIRYGKKKCKECWEKALKGE